MRTKASNTTLALIVVLALVVLTTIGGLAFKIASSGSDAEAAHPVNLAANSFPAPADATVSLPPANGVNPPSTVRSWKVSGSLDQACLQWRELFRVWIDQGAQNQVGGESFPGSSCEFTAKKNGFDSVLRVASYAGSQPEATLVITDNL